VVNEHEIRVGDCIELMRQLPPCSVDSIVTDPPYGLEFMGKDWDTFRVDLADHSRFRGENAGAQGRATSDANKTNPAAGKVEYGAGKHPRTSRCSGCGRRDQFRNAHGCPETAVWRAEIINPFCAPPTSLAFQNWVRSWALEAMRVLKPGGHLLAFGATRMYHRLACGIEDAGFEVRDSLQWVYGTGFPKSHNVGKSIDREAGATRQVVGTKVTKDISRNLEADRAAGVTHGQGKLGAGSTSIRVEVPVTAPATEAAKTWDGWGTALKPAHEPVVVARKPMETTVASTVVEHGTGALNVAACRVGGAAGGRWPTNVLMAHLLACDPDSGACVEGCPIRELDRQAPDVGATDVGPDRWFDDHGGASRFFPCFRYVAKPDRAERDAGLHGIVPCSICGGLETTRHGVGGRSIETDLFGVLEAETMAPCVRNAHPTVKPVEAMRWLVRLVTPPGGLVVDPFTGSGTTGIAAKAEGLRFLGFEQGQEHADLARARIENFPV